jgi:CheY-like chemotaxis protein
MTDEKARILVVDDVPENIQVLTEVLQDKYTVLAAVNGTGALKIAASANPPELILLDIMMPRMDGYEVCRRLKSFEGTKDIPVIFVTARHEVVDEQRGFEAGAVDYITKPITPSIVEARVHAHLSLTKARKQLEEQNEELIKAAKLREDVERITRHDLKSPLNAIIGVPQLLELEGNLTDEQLEYVGMITEAGQKMLRMINLSLDLFKMEQGLYKLDRSPVEIVSVLRNVLRETQSVTASFNISVRILIEGKPADNDAAVSISGEELLCYSPFSNLVKNAVEASPQGEQVVINIRPDKSVAVSMTNRGEVPREIRDTFFDKYVTSGKENGTGLGTYSAKLITETLNGLISLDYSEPESTTITVELPGL